MFPKKADHALTVSVIHCEVGEVCFDERVNVLVFKVLDSIPRRVENDGCGGIEDRYRFLSEGVAGAEESLRTILRDARGP